MMFLQMKEKETGKKLYSFCLGSGALSVIHEDRVVWNSPYLEGAEGMFLYRAIPCKKGIVLIDKEKKVYLLSTILKEAGQKQLKRMNGLDGADYVFISDFYTFFIKNEKLYMSQKDIPATTPKLINVPQPVSVMVVGKAGYETVFVLTKSGEVYAFGTNQYGLLGKGRKYSLLLSRCADNLIKIDLPPIRKIEGENGKVFALSESGNLYGWGCNEDREILSDLPIDKICSPRFIFENVKDFSVGTDHGLLLTNDGEVYGWGKVSTILAGGFEMNELDFVNTTGPVCIPIKTCKGAEKDFLLSVHVDQYLSVVCTSRGLIVWGTDLWNVFGCVPQYRRNQNKPQFFSFETLVGRTNE